MDIARPSNVRQKRIRQAISIGIGLVVIVAISVGLSRLQPAAPTVEAATLWPDTVKRGPMVLQVRGLGTLVPEDIRWIPATTQGRVERIVLRPGTTVTPDSVILELTNDQLETDVQDAELKLQAAEASLANLRVQMQNELLQQKAAAASVDADYNKARMQAEMNEALAKDQLVSDLILRQSKLDADQLSIRRDIAQEQLATRAEASRAQIAVAQSSVDQARAVLQLRRRQKNELRVRAGLTGMLQLVPVDVGQQVAPGIELGRLVGVAVLVDRDFACHALKVLCLVYRIAEFGTFGRIGSADRFE
jgi:HlyD family secretion protein